MRAALEQSAKQVLGSGKPVRNRLRELMEMKDGGEITEEEYAEQRKRILNSL
jgi:hypothetical protein